VPPLAHEGCPALDEPSAGEEERAKVFALLAGTDWEGVDCGEGMNGVPFRCDRVSFRSDGSYTWTAWSDFSERDETGQWSFFAESATRGTLFFSSGSTDLFIHDPSTGELETSRAVLRPGAMRAISGTADALPKLEPYGLYRGLLGSCWRKTNDFDDDHVPDEIVFGKTGWYRASYRRGECEHGGRFAIDARNVSQAVEGNDCALGSGGRIPSVLPEVIDGLLVFWEGSYRPRADASSEHVFFVDRGRLETTASPVAGEEPGTYPSVRVRGRHEGAFTQGSPTALHLELENMGTAPVRLRDLSLELKAVSADGGSVTGEVDYHLLGSFGAERLFPGEPIALARELVPAVAGEFVPATFALTYTNASGTAEVNWIDVVLPVHSGTPVPLTPRREPSAPTGRDPPNYSLCGALANRVRVESAALSSDGALLVQGLSQPDGSVLLFEVGALAPTADVPTLMPVARIPGTTMPQNDVIGVVFGGDWLARAVRGRIEGYGLAGGEWTPSFAVGEYGNSYRSRLALAPDGRVFAAGASGGVAFHAAGSGARVGYLQVGEVLDGSFAVYAPDGRIATLGDSPLVRLWDPMTGTLLMELSDHTSRVSCGGFSGDDLLLTGSHDNTLVVWDTRQGSLVRRIDAGDNILDCTFLPDGTIIAVVGTNLVSFRSDDGGGPLVIGVGSGLGLVASADGTRIAAGFGVYCRGDAP
jgi:hypothetical protein